jgi:ubiquinone/menaquinone biosynthesis C-methylase UbiE
MEASSQVRIGSDNWSATMPGEQTERLAAYLNAMAATSKWREGAEHSLALLNLTPGQSVLEVGCGTGVFLPLLAAAVGPGGRVVGIDHSPQFVTAAHERSAAAGVADVVTVQEADAYRLPFADATFDAAHCERVLMHLDDPTAALREMRRVVKPGGVVVAGETHWHGWQIDSPDHEAMELLIDRFTAGVRQPRMGLTLNRRMHEAGLVGREIVLVTLVGTRYEEFTQFGFRLDVVAEALVAEGRIDRERVDAVLGQLAQASAEESLTVAAVAYFIVAGRVPVS